MSRTHWAKEALLGSPGTEGAHVVVVGLVRDVLPEAHAGQRQREVEETLGSGVSPGVPRPDVDLLEEFADRRLDAPQALARRSRPDDHDRHVGRAGPQVGVAFDEQMDAGGQAPGQGRHAVGQAARLGQEERGLVGAGGFEARPVPRRRGRPRPAGPGARGRPGARRRRAQSRRPRVPARRASRETPTTATRPPPFCRCRPTFLRCRRQP